MLVSHCWPEFKKVTFVWAHAEQKTDIYGLKETSSQEKSHVFTPGMATYAPLHSAAKALK